MIPKEVKQKFRDPHQRTDPAGFLLGQGQIGQPATTWVRRGPGTPHTLEIDIQLVLLFLAPPSHQFSETLPSLKYLGSSLRLSHYTLRKPPS